MEQRTKRCNGGAGTVVTEAEILQGWHTELPFKDTNRDIRRETLDEETDIEEAMEDTNLNLSGLRELYAAPVQCFLRSPLPQLWN